MKFNKECVLHLTSERSLTVVLAHLIFVREPFTAWPSVGRAWVVTFEHHDALVAEVHRRLQQKGCGNVE